MPNIAMPTIVRRTKRLGVYITVPGGWIARVPDVKTGNTALLDAYTEYFVSCGLGAKPAAEAAEATVQRTYAHGYVDGLKEAVARRAEEYIALYPELRRVVGRRNGLPLVEPVGYDPGAIQASYVPFQRTGRAGQSFMATMLAAMAKRAKATNKEHK